jgi:hypothetical protein
VVAAACSSSSGGGNKGRGGGGGVNFPFAFAVVALTQHNFINFSNAEFKPNLRQI